MCRSKIIKCLKSKIKNMKQNFLIPALLVIAVSALTVLPGCGAIESIFKAGIWVGVIAVVAIVGIIALLFKSFGGK